LLSVGHNAENIRAIMPDAPVYSLRMLFDPEITAKFAPCGITMLDDACPWWSGRCANAACR